MKKTLLPLPQALLELLDLLHVPHDGSPPSILKGMQTHWLQLGKERWECDRRGEEKKTLVFPLLEKLHQIERISAKHTYYDYCLVHGGVADRMLRRLNMLHDTWNKGVRFGKLVFLTGERYLDPAVEKEYLIFSTEAQLMVHLFDNIRHLFSCPLQVVDTPRGEKKRPITIDTVNAWLATLPKPGSCLALSDQPFVCYHHTATETHLPSSFSLETIGEKSDKNTWVAVYLDNLARTFYQEMITWDPSS